MGHDVATAHVEPRPVQYLRHVGGNGRGDEHLIGIDDGTGKSVPSGTVELGEDVVKNCLLYTSPSPRDV